MVQHDRRSNWRLVVTLSVSHVVLLVCTAVSLYMSINYGLLDAKNDDGNRDIFIQFDAIADISGNQTLKFTYFTSRMMNVTDEGEIDVSCNGPYILHVYACSKGLDGREGRGSLELRLARTDGTKLAAASLALTGNNVACEGLHATVYLRKQQRATLHFSGDQNLKIKNVTLGLQYLLGQCQY